MTLLVQTFIDKPKYAVYMLYIHNFLYYYKYLFQAFNSDMHVIQHSLMICYEYWIYKTLLKHVCTLMD